MYLHTHVQNIHPAVPGFRDQLYPTDTPRFRPRRRRAKPGYPPIMPSQDAGSQVHVTSYRQGSPRPSPTIVLPLCLQLFIPNNRKFSQRFAPSSCLRVKRVMPFI